MTGEPTPGEVMRRLEDNTAQLNRIAAQMQTDRDRADLRYVPRGEWIEGRRADQGFIKDVAADVAEIKVNAEDDAKEKKSFRNQIIVGFLVVLATSFGSLIVALIVLLLSGGKA